jgi:hypothetical protein
MGSEALGATGEGIAKPVVKGAKPVVACVSGCAADIEGAEGMAGTAAQVGATGASRRSDGSSVQAGNACMGAEAWAWVG